VNIIDSKYDSKHDNFCTCSSAVNWALG